MFELFGLTIYITKLWPFFFIGLYVPLVVAAIYWGHRLLFHRISDTRWRRWVVGTLAIVLITAPMWDVLWISAEAKKLCATQAGIHVFRTVQANSVITGFDPVLLRRGFAFTEGIAGKGKKFRYRMLNGVVVEEEIEVFSSRYSFRGFETAVVGWRFSKDTYVIADRSMGEVLSEWVTIHIYPGWLDAWIGHVLAFRPMWMCGYDLPPGAGDEVSSATMLILQTVIPKQTQDGVTQ